MEFTSNVDGKVSTRYTYITFPRYYLVCVAAVFIPLRWHSSLPRCYIFSPAVDAKWEHASKDLIGSTVAYLQSGLCYLQFKEPNGQTKEQTRIVFPWYNVNRSLVKGVKLVKLDDSSDTSVTVEPR